ncbi:MAG: glycoside hydrolase, partial [bacterium]|nr:glycoside hydrolase [bacterium]
LGSWTAQGGEWERFGGTARYEIEFELPAGVKADDWLLDLGDVRETARVFVNGRETDLVWSLPMRTRIGPFLKPGKNTLALEVTNLAANRIRDLEKRGVAWKNFYEINFVNIFYERFNGAVWPLQPSGLLGSVKLVPLQAFTP